MNAVVGHSTLGASAAHRWMACPGSVRLSRGLPPPKESAFAAEGKAAHTLGERCLKNDDLVPADFLGEVIDEIEVTEEMVEAVQVYVQTVRGDRAMLGGTLLVEHPFHLADLDPELWGTNDACLLTKQGALIVYDYKHGRGVPVEVEDNPQLKYYALGALLEFAKKKRRVQSVEIVIVQPRCDHPDGAVRRCGIELVDLYDWTMDLLAAVAKTRTPDAPLVAGEHCRWCPAGAAGACPEIARYTARLAAIDFQDVASSPPAPDTLNISQLLEVLRKADVVEQWIRDVKAYAEQLMESGMQLPGFKLVQKRPTRQWRGEEKDVASVLLGEFGLARDQVYETVLRSPAQVEKLLKGQKDRQKALEELWEKRSSGYVLAPESDPRPALPPPAVADFAAFAQK